MKENKNTIIVLLCVIIAILVSLVVLLATNTINFNSSTINNKEENNLSDQSQDNQEDENDNSNTNADLNNYKGSWYLDEESETRLDINSVNGNELTLFIYRLTQLDNITAIINGNSGSFSDELGTKGTIELKDNNIKIIITESTLNIVGQQYDFTYKLDTYKDKLSNGFWYNNGTILFFNDNRIMIGKYGSDGGYNGTISTFEKEISNTNSHIYKITAIHEACTSDSCMEQTNGYTLEIEIEYNTLPNESITIKSININENNISKQLDQLEKDYNFAGNSWDEVDNYVNNLNNKNN